MASATGAPPTEHETTTHWPINGVGRVRTPPRTAAERARRGRRRHSPTQVAPMSRPAQLDRIRPLPRDPGVAR